MTTIAAGLSVSQLWSVANCGVQVVIACPYAGHVFLLFLFLLLSCSLVCLCKTIALMLMHMPGISSSLFVSWMYLDSQLVVNSCGPGFYNILMLYQCILNSIL